MGRSVLEVKMDILRYIKDNPNASSTRMFNQCNLQSTRFWEHVHILADSGLLQIEDNNDRSDKRWIFKISITFCDQAVLKKYEEILATLK